MKRTKCYNCEKVRQCVETGRGVWLCSSCHDEMYDSFDADLEDTNNRYGPLAVEEILAEIESEAL